MTGFSQLLHAAGNAPYEAEHRERNGVQYLEEEMQSQNRNATVTWESHLALPPSTKCVINIDSIVDRCGGDREFAKGIIDRFRQQAVVEVEQIDTALGAKDIEALRRAAHTVKSMSAYIDASVATELCWQLESMARENQLEGAASVLHALHQEIDCIMHCIETNSIALQPIAAPAAG